MSRNCDTTRLARAAADSHAHADNQEALYYGIYSANHAELGGPYYNAMLQYIPRGRKDALSYWQCPGINMDCEIFHWGQSTSGVGDQGQRSNSALAAVPLANHWLWTRDVAWLNSTGEAEG